METQFEQSLIAQILKHFKKTMASVSIYKLCFEDRMGWFHYNGNEFRFELTESGKKIKSKSIKFENAIGAYPSFN